MPNKFAWFLLCLLPPFLAIGDANTNMMATAMLAELEACFAGRRTPEEMVNEWRWGEVKYASAFDLRPASSENSRFGMVFTACPLPEDTGSTRMFYLKDFPKAGEGDAGDKPYLSFGIQKDGAASKYSLVYAFCGSYSALYPHFLKSLKLDVPSFEDVRSKSPDQCWATTMHGKDCFTPSPVDDQFIRWKELNPEIDIVFRFRDQQCTGAMLVRKKNMPGKTREKDSAPAVKTLDMRAFSNDFKWMPGHQVKRFDEINARTLAKGGKARRRDNLERLIKLYKNNTEHVDRLGLKFSGSIETPLNEHLDAPWQEFCFYRTVPGNVVLRGHRGMAGLYGWERAVSFVLDVEDTSGESRIMLPYGLNIKPRLRTIPTEGLLYEHVRCDGRARIVVQPHIAWLYEDGSLTKIMVCIEKDGPPDHGWSLVREFYCYERMGYFYWPVYRAAYDPFGE